MDLYFIYLWTSPYNNNQNKQMKKKKRKKENDKNRQKCQGNRNNVANYS